MPYVKYSPFLGKNYTRCRVTGVCGLKVVSRAVLWVKSADLNQAKMVRESVAHIGSAKTDKCY